jgi:leucyl aminopeptidase
VLLCAIAAGCTQPAAEVGSKQSPLAPQTEEYAWITAAPDALDILARLLAEPPLVHDLGAGSAPGSAVALHVPTRILPELSQIAHEERGRCGGFMLHDSEAEALAALQELQQPAHSSTNQFLLAPPYTVDNGATVEALLPEVKETNVLATIRKLSSFRNRFHTSMTGAQASMWIRDTWRALATGRDDISVELVEHTATPQPSIVMTIRGTKLPEEIVVLGGHMDSIAGRGGATVLAPGADDNASGIAVLTEVARAALELGYRPERTVRFYGYAAEEVGLVGSAEIAAKAKAERLNVVGVMQLDMTNYTSSSTPYISLIRDNTDAALNAFSIKLIETYVKMPWKYHNCGYACSDHASWTKNGFVSTFPHEAIMEEGNKRIHTPDDTLALSKDSASHSMHFARFGVAFLAELAKGSLASAPQCSASKPCPVGERCEAGMCMAPADAGTAPPAATAGCSASKPCPAGESCESGTCVAQRPSSTACDTRTPCPSGSSCQSGACVAAARDAGARDGGAATTRDSARADAGRSPQPSTDDESDDEGDDESDDDGLDSESEAASAGAKRAGGCSAGSRSSAAAASWIALLAAAIRRRRRSANCASFERAH